MPHLVGFLERCLKREVQVLGVRDFAYRSRFGPGESQVTELEREFWVLDELGRISDESYELGSTLVVLHAHTPHLWTDERDKPLKERTFDTIVQLNIRRSSRTPSVQSNPKFGRTSGSVRRTSVFEGPRWPQPGTHAVPLLRAMKDTGGWEWRTDKGRDARFNKEHRTPEEWKRFKNRTVEVDPRGWMQTVFVPYQHRLGGDWKVFVQNALHSLLLLAERDVVQKGHELR